MNLAELYAQTPVEKHQDIKVAGDKVFVKGVGGDAEEYLVDSQGELWLVRSDKELREDVAAIRNKLSA